MLHYWPDRTSIWRPSIIVLLLLFVFVLFRLYHVFSQTRAFSYLLYPYASRDHVIV